MTGRGTVKEVWVLATKRCCWLKRVDEEVTEQKMV